MKPTLLCLLVFCAIIGTVLVSLIWNISYSMTFYVDKSLQLQLLDQQTSTLARDINVTLFPRMVFGIGCQKGGSTYLNNLLFMNYRNHRDPNIKVEVARKELHFWNECFIPYLTRKMLKVSAINQYATRCNVDQYLALHWNWSYSTNTQNTDQKRSYIFIEKSPVYFKYYHSSYLLSAYAHIYDIRFYLLLRDPIQRLWSSYWMRSKLGRLNARYNNSSVLADIDSMQNMIASDLHRFPAQYPHFAEILTLLNAASDSDSLFSSEINATRIVDVWRSGVYNIHSKLNAPNLYPNLIKSCYFPQLLMWNYNFNVAVVQAQQQSGLTLEHRLKIIQSQQLFDEPQLVVCKLMQWIEGTQETQCEAIQIGSASKPRKQNNYAPKSVRVADLAIYPQLQSFYDACNRHLYAFLDNYRGLLLMDNFTRFW